MAVFTNRNPDWMNWIAPDRFDDHDLFRIVVFLSFIHRVLKYPLCAKRLKNMDGLHRGENHII